MPVLKSRESIEQEMNYLEEQIEMLNSELEGADSYNRIRIEFAIAETRETLESLAAALLLGGEA